MWVGQDGDMNRTLIRTAAITFALIAAPMGCNWQSQPDGQAGKKGVTVANDTTPLKWA